MACVYRHWPKKMLYHYDLTKIHWFDAGKLCRDVVYARADRDEGRIINTMRDAHLIVVDDIGTREPTASQLDAILAILEWRGRKPMIVTGNCNPVELKTLLDDRIASRLTSGVLIEFGGNDLRLDGAVAI